VKKKIKAITETRDEDLERKVNTFLEAEGARWRLVAVTSGAGYRTAWLEFEG
jgi:hypothetical protein